VVAVEQVVERPEEQHRVVRGVGDTEGARVAQNGRHPGQRAGRRHVLGHRVDDVHPVAGRGERFGVGAGCPTHVEHRSGRWRQHA
jgi:hypothetical protein